MIKVVAALIENDNRVLLARRSTGDVNVLGKWNLPGSKVEQDENGFAAIEREIKEEFELKLKQIVERIDEEESKKYIFQK